MAHPYCDQEIGKTEARPESSRVLSAIKKAPETKSAELHFHRGSTEIKHNSFLVCFSF